MGVKISDSATALLLLKLWQNKHDTNAIDFVAASTWADQNDLYPKPPITRQKRLEEEMRRAVKQHRHTDPQGRKRVKTYGAMPLFDPKTGRETFTYVDMRISRKSQAKSVLDHEFKLMQNDPKSHNISRVSFNDNTLFGEEIEPYDYNFNAVAEEAALTGEYDDTYDDDDGED